MLAPNEPIGNSSVASWCRRLLRWCKSIEIQSGVGYRVRKGSGGTTLELLGVAGGAAVTPVGRFRVKSVQGDYVTCRTWDGTTEGSSDVLVAKPPQLRHSISSQPINGVTVSYSGYSIDGTTYVCSRTASGSGYSDQTEYVLPVWQKSTGQDSELWAFKPKDGTGVTDCDWLDLNIDARAWCEVFPAALL